MNSKNNHELKEKRVRFAHRHTSYRAQEEMLTLSSSCLLTSNLWFYMNVLSKINSNLYFYSQNSEHKKQI